MENATWTIGPCPEAGVQALVTELGVSTTTASVLARRGYGDPAAARAFLEGALPGHDPFALGDMGDAVAKINGILFLHGGISPAVAPTSCDDINATVQREITTDFDQTQKAPLSSLAARVDGPLFYRGLAEESDAFEPQVDEILAKQGVKAIVIGHTVSPTGRIRPRFGGKVFQLDTAMQPAYVPNGRASALEIKDGQFTAIYVDRKDTLTSPPTPAASSAPR